MKILMVAGGSGGHIYPCLELAKYFRQMGDEVVLAGKINSLEEKIYKENNFAYYGIDIDKSRIFSYFRNFKKINKVYKDGQYDVIVLFGNYISVPFGLCAWLNNIPVYLHEQNVIYGRANKLLGYKAKKIYLSLPLIKDIHSKKSVLIGNPKAESIYEKINLDKRYYNVIIAMGSLGSTTMNLILKEFINNNKEENVIYHIVVGKKYYDSFIADINIKDNIKIYPYLENLSSYIRECDVFVSRAGATTISEIIYNKVVSVLIPSPYVKDNHQYLNAKYLYDNNACVLIKENDLDEKILAREIAKLLNNHTKMLDIKIQLKKLKVTDTKKKIYEDIINDYKR